MISEGKHETFFEVLGPVSITAKNGVSISNCYCTGLSEKFAQFSFFVREFCMDTDKIAQKRS